MTDCYRWWWPIDDPTAYWPSKSYEVTIENFVMAFEAKGYRLCVGSHREWGYEKVAIYANHR
ncbi:MAG: hypothetical protein WB992_19600, partial [Bryobacteraceae bacterium]